MPTHEVPSEEALLLLSIQLLLPKQQCWSLANSTLFLFREVSKTAVWWCRLCHCEHRCLLRKHRICCITSTIFAYGRKCVSAVFELICLTTESPTIRDVWVCSVGFRQKDMVTGRWAMCPPAHFKGVTTSFDWWPGGLTKQPDNGVRAGSTGARQGSGCKGKVAW